MDLKWQVLRFFLWANVSRGNAYPEATAVACIQYRRSSSNQRTNSFFFSIVIVYFLLAI